MSSVIQAAVKGERNALRTLYKENRQKVWSIACSLLLEQKQAASVTSAVFRELWRELKLGSIATKEDFTGAAVNKAAEQCAAVILQKNPRAFQLPYDKDFHLPAGAAVNFRYETEPEYYLSNLPALQRLIFVLHAVGGWGALRIARVLQWDSSVVRAAMETEADTFGQLQQLSQRSYNSDYEDILHMFSQWENENTLPDALDSQLLEGVEALVSPQAEQAKRRRVSIAVFCAVVCIGLLAIILRSVEPAPKKDKDSAETTEVTDTVEETAETTEDPNAPYSPSPLDSDVIYYADLEIEGYGTIVIQLDQQAAPITCANFVELAEMGYYDFLTIHSITDGSMIQGGDPTIGGSIITSRHIVGEFSENGYDNPLSHTAGAVSMVRSSDYDSASSAFSILRTDRTDMDGEYAVFGYVIEGMDVLEDICSSVLADDTGYIEEDDQPVIDSLYIREEEPEDTEDFE